MTEILRIKKNIDFKKIYKRGKSVPDKYLVLYLNKNNENFIRVGFTASKKVGKSVTRNRARRLLKESFRSNSENIKNGFDIVFIARVAIKDAKYKEVEKSMKRSLQKSGLLN